VNPTAQVRKIVALSEIDGTESVVCAIEDDVIFVTFSNEHIAGLFQQIDATPDSVRPPMK